MYWFMGSRPAQLHVDEVALHPILVPRTVLPSVRPTNRSASYRWVHTSGFVPVAARGHVVLDRADFVEDPVDGLACASGTALYGSRLDVWASGLGTAASNQVTGGTVPDESLQRGSCRIGDGLSLRFGYVHATW